MLRKIAKYLIGTFLFSWIMWGIVALGGALKIEWLQYGKPVGMVFFVLGGLTPAICEIFLQKKECEKKEFKMFLKSIVDFKHCIWLYIYAVGGAILYFLVPAIAGYSKIVQPFYMGFLLIVPMIIGGGLEEIGWRGLLQPELEKRLPHWGATLIVGVVWALWHLPLWFIEGTNQSKLSLVWFMINALTLSYFIGSVRYITGSIFMAILAHASINAFWEVMTVTNEILPSLIILVVVATITMILDYIYKRVSVVRI